MNRCTVSLPRPNHSWDSKYSSVAPWFCGPVMISQGMSAPYQRRAACSFSANSAKSVSFRSGVTGNIPFGPSNPRREPWPPATVRNAVRPRRISSSPASRACVSVAARGERDVRRRGDLAVGTGARGRPFAAAMTAARSSSTRARSSDERSSRSRCRSASGRLSQCAKRCSWPIASSLSRMSPCGHELSFMLHGAPRRAVISASMRSERICAKRAATSGSDRSELLPHAPLRALDGELAARRGGGGTA